MQLHQSFAATLFSIALAVGASSSTSVRAQPPPEQGRGHGQQGQMQQMKDEMCPMHVPGATVSSSQTKNAAVLTFTTKTGDVLDLRQRVRLMAAHQNTSKGKMMPSATATVRDIEGGAQVIMTPHDPAQLPTLIEHNERRAVHMSQGTCPMM